MTSRPELPRPPRIAVALVGLTVPYKQAESVLGDLQEEFSEFASNSAVGFARR